MNLVVILNQQEARQHPHNLWDSVGWSFPHCRNWGGGHLTATSEVPAAPLLVPGMPELALLAESGKGTKPLVEPSSILPLSLGISCVLLLTPPAPPSLGSHLFYSSHIQFSKLLPQLLHQKTEGGG